MSHSLAKAWDAIANLRRSQPKPRVNRVLATDPETNTFTVEVEGAEPLSGISSAPQFLPAPGDMVRLTMYGGVPVYEPSGLVGVDTSNVGNLAGLNVTDDPRIMGENFTSHLDRKSQIVAWTAFWNPTGPTTDEIGMVEIAFQAKPGHVYAIHAVGMLPDVTGGGDDHIVPFLLRATFDGTPPNISSSYLMGSTQVRSRFDLYPWENTTASIHAMHFEPLSASGRTVRVMVSIVKPPGATYVDIYGDPALSRRYFWAEDLGRTPGDTGQVNTGGGTVSTGTPPPPPPPVNAKIDGESVFDATWVSNFRGNLSYVDFAEAYQGYDQGTGGNGNMRSFIGFPDMAGPLAGATIRYVRVWLWYGHWYNGGGGYPLIGFHTNASKVLTPTGQYADVVAQPLLGRGAGGWFDVNPGWGDLIRDGVVKGIALGPGPDNGAQYYGRANGPGQANAPRLAIGWTK